MKIHYATNIYIDKYISDHLEIQQANTRLKSSRERLAKRLTSETFRPAQSRSEMTWNDLQVSYQQ